MASGMMGMFYYMYICLFYYYYEECDLGLEMVLRCTNVLSQCRLGQNFNVLVSFWIQNVLSRTKFRTSQYLSYCVSWVLKGIGHIPDYCDSVMYLYHTAASVEDAASVVLHKQLSSQ